MKEALEAIAEITAALSEFGSDVIYRSIVQGSYNPMTGETTETVTDTPTKASIKAQATIETQRAYGADYEKAFMIYLQHPPDMKSKIVFDGKVYNIVYIVPSKLQNIDFKYEILGKR